MRGTLENPPLVVEQSRDKLLLMLAASIAFLVFFGGLTWSHAARSMFWGDTLTIIFGALSIGLCPVVIRPGRLILAPDGLTWRTYAPKDHYQWNEFSSFLMWTPRPLVHAPAFILTVSCQKWRRSRRLLAGFTGGAISFGGGWELGAAEMLEFLKGAQARWRFDGQEPGSGSGEPPCDSISI